MRMRHRAMACAFSVLPLACAKALPVESSGQRAPIAAVNAPSSIPPSSIAPEASVAPDARAPAREGEWVNLAPVGPSATGPKGSMLHLVAMGDNVLAIDEREARVLSPGSRTPTAILPMRDLSVAGSLQPGDKVVVAGALLAVAAKRKALFAYEAGTLTERWSVPVTDGAFLSGAAESAGVIAVYLRSLRGRDEEVLAVDAATGAIKWRRPGPIDGIFAGGGRIFLGERGKGPKQRLRAFDPATGRELWATDTPFQNVLASDRWVVAIYGDARVRVLDPTTGKQQRAVTTPGRVWWRSDAVLDGETLYLGVTSQDPLLPTPGNIYAYDLRSGQQLWQASDAGRAVANDTPTGLQIAGSTLLACTKDGAIRAIDRASGATRWSWGLGECSSFAMAGGVSPALYVRGPEAQLVVLLPSDVPAEHAVVTGRAVVSRHGIVQGTPDGAARVQIANTEVTPDKTGAFRAEVDGRGLLTISAIVALKNFGSKCEPFAQGTGAVKLDGKGSYAVDIELSQKCW